MDEDEEDERGAAKAAALGALAARADARGTAYDAEGGARAARAAAGGKEAGAWLLFSRAATPWHARVTRSRRHGLTLSCPRVWRRRGPVSPRVLQGVCEGGGRC